MIKKLTGWIVLSLFAAVGFAMLTLMTGGEPDKALLVGAGLVGVIWGLFGVLVLIGWAIKATGFRE